MSFLPFVSFDSIPLDEANRLLVLWAHEDGPINRPNNDTLAHALLHEGRPVAVTTTSWLIRDHVGGGLVHLTRENTCELSRLCAERRDLNRVVLRLWREFVFPVLHHRAAISYQHAVRHSGDLYRFDGWKRAAFAPGGGLDKRSGHRGRPKWVWCWPPSASEAASFARECAA